MTGEDYAREAARVYPKSREQARRRDTEFDLVDRIHEAEDESLRQPPTPAHSFVVTLETDDFTEEKYHVYENYQRVVHHETPEDYDRESFKRFLCSSPLRHEKLISPDGRELQLGSFREYILYLFISLFCFVSPVPYPRIHVFTYSHALKRFCPLLVGVVLL